MFRRFVYSFSLLLVTVSTASAFDLPFSGMVESQIAMNSKTGNTVRFNSNLSRSISGPIGAYVFIQVGPGYRQMYGGPTLAPTSWSQIGYAIGAESYGSHDRRAWFARVSHDRFAAVYIHEDGGSGPWHKTFANYVVSPQLTIGVLDQHGAGTGPKVDWKLPGTKVQFQGANLWNAGVATHIVRMHVDF